MLLSDGDELIVHNVRFVKIVYQPLSVGWVIVNNMLEINKVWLAPNIKRKGGINIRILTMEEHKKLIKAKKAILFGNLLVKMRVILE